MVAEIGAPGAAAGDEGLHERPLGLDGVHEVVGGPLVKHIAQADEAQLRVAGRAGQVGVGEAGQECQARPTQVNEPLRQVRGAMLRIRLRALRIRVEGGEVAARQECLDAHGKHGAFGVQQVKQAVQRRPFAGRRRSRQQVGGKRLCQRLPAGGRDGENSLHLVEKIGHGKWSPLRHRSARVMATRLALMSPPSRVVRRQWLVSHDCYLASNNGGHVL